MSHGTRQAYLDALLGNPSPRPIVTQMKEATARSHERLREAARALHDAVVAGAAAGSRAGWAAHVGEVVQQLGLHTAYIGVVHGDTAYACAIFPQPAAGTALWTFAMRDTLTGWLCERSGGVAGLTALGRDPRFASTIAHVRSGGVSAFAGMPFRIGGRQGFLGLNGFADRPPFSAKELDAVEQLASDLRLLFQTQLTELTSIERGSIGDAAEEERLRTELAAAVQRDEMLLHYQPYWDLQEERITGLEALVRWDSPARGLVSPADFIPLAERTGLIRQIGSSVRQKAFAYAARETPAWDIGVNLSPMEIDDLLPSRLQSAMEAAQIDARRVIIEITESTAMQTSERILGALRKCRSLGVRIAIDDFGAGYANVESLNLLPVDIVKIDRHIVGGLPENGVDAAVARAAIDIARSYGAEVIAEGVETQDQLEWLRLHGCTKVQGYLISRPVAAPHWNQVAGP